MRKEATSWGASAQSHSLTAHWFIGETSICNKQPWHWIPEAGDKHHTLTNCMRMASSLHSAGSLLWAIRSYIVHISTRKVECISIWRASLSQICCEALLCFVMLKQYKNAVCVCVVLDNMQAFWRWLHHSIHCWKQVFLKPALNNILIMLNYVFSWHMITTFLLNSPPLHATFQMILPDGFL